MEITGDQKQGQTTAANMKTTCYPEAGAPSPHGFIPGVTA